ncbi:MAG TPA: Gfo/Idh/MocA family oxidoreductase [Candidatus Limnocylindrales bacterium]|nr:Gfo/Idh/MocA family oxidoreductase [Candidatus Limnocylindrales bacterium]
MLKADLVGVGVIGTGRAGMVHVRNFAENVPGARLVAVCDADQESARETARVWSATSYDSPEELLKDPFLDAVVISTPTFTHADMVIKAAEAGKAILCEKPLAITEDEARFMDEAVKRSGVVFVMAFMRRFDRSFQRAREMILRGDIGEPLMIKSTGKGPGLPPRWNMDLSQSNGMLAEVNSHDFDCVRFLTGEEYRWVFATARNNKCLELAGEFPDFYDTAIVTFGMSGKVIGTIDGACPADYGYDARVEIQGTDGVLFIGNIAQKGVIMGRKGIGVTEEIVDSWRTLFREAYLAEDRCLIECMQKGIEPPSKLDDGWKALQAVRAANRSIMSGKVEQI